ncbi:MAG: cation:proton antiporter [Phycisphaerales bacterium]|nr:cation:proton antiporter [Phycisphaerales bacterium]
MDLPLYTVIMLTILSVAFLLAFIRLAIGPSLPDRVMALDVMAAIGVTMTTLYSVTRNLPVFLDVAIVLALVSFVGTVALARYLEKRV